jgi:hypothetical protein
MPPKKQQEKVKKIVEDKTFGMKNKNKSKKVQQYIQQVSQSATMAGKSRKDFLAEQERQKARQLQKSAAEEAKKAEAELFKAVVKETKVPLGVDPKSVVCEFFKAGKCMKGNKCKFSHDLALANKSARIDVHMDPRDLDTMDKWDQSKLESVIATKAKGSLPPTEIVCKYFLDAIEQGKYGWFWDCPNGATCHYRHALPPGFVLKSKQKEEKVDEEEQPDIGEKIEEQREKLDLSKCTKVTYESFLAWKEQKRLKYEDEVDKKKREVEKKGGSGLVGMTGRDLFRYDPSLFVDDAAADDETYEITATEEDEYEEKEDQALYDKNIQDLAKTVDQNLFLDDDIPDDLDDEDEKAPTSSSS